VLFGASGTLRSALQKTLEVKGHAVIGITRKSGQFLADIQGIESLRAVYKQIGSSTFACAAGDMFPAPLEQTTDEQWANSFKSKAVGQINLVRAALLRRHQPRRSGDYLRFQLLA
jgi:NAD(P)-dependent dehydrogenase (short-subunit alcohol dehydrogenase family)